MISNFERYITKSKNKQILKVIALYLMWNPKICKDPATWSQDDLVLLWDFSPLKQTAFMGIFNGTFSHSGNRKSKIGNAEKVHKKNWPYLPTLDFCC